MRLEGVQLALKLRPMRIFRCAEPNLIFYPGVRTDSNPSLGTLVDAIEVLHNLIAFAWYGPLPITPCEVVDALRRSSGQKVVDILLQ